MHACIRYQARRCDRFVACQNAAAQLESRAAGRYHGSPPRALLAFTWIKTVTVADSQVVAPRWCVQVHLLFVGCVAPATVAAYKCTFYSQEHQCVPLIHCIHIGNM